MKEFEVNWMNEKELMQTALRYQMSMGFLNCLFNDGKLKKDEFDVAAKYVAERYDIEAVEYALAKLHYSNLQTQKSNVCKEPMPELIAEKVEVPYVSLTDIAKKFSDEPPSYVVQSWMRSRSTIEFLKLWEQRHNDRFSMDGYEMLMGKFNAGTFTMTPKQWVTYTGAIGISTKPGKNGGTHAHQLLATEFMMWLSPIFKIDLLELLNLKKEG